PVLTVDTTTTNMLVNSGFEGGTTSWAARGTTSAFIADTTTANVYHGLKSLKSTVSLGNSGMQTSGGQAAFTANIAINTQYQFTFYARCTSSIATLTFGRE